jgi:hypothetical protein
MNLDNILVSDKPAELDRVRFDSTPRTTASGEGAPVERVSFALLEDLEPTKYWGIWTVKNKWSVHDDEGLRWVGAYPSEALAIAIQQIGYRCGTLTPGAYVRATTFQDLCEAARTDGRAGLLIARSMTECDHLPV